MNEKEYKKALEERDKENKRINDQFTMDDQKVWSRKRVAELDKQIADYESKNGINSGNTQKSESGNTQNTGTPTNTPASTPASTPTGTPASKPKTYLEEQMEKSRQNGLNMSAAYTPNLGSTESASLGANPDFLAAENKRNEAKMQNASIPENKAAVEEAEKEVQDLYKNKLAELLDEDKESAQAEADISKAVADTKGDGKKTTPENVITNLSNEYHISTNFTPDGKIVPTEESQWQRADMAGKLAMFGTALSCIVSAMSGGNIPPINFNKIVGVDKQYTAYLANVHQYNEAISAGIKKEAENKADVDLGNYLDTLPEKKRRLITDILSDYQFTKSLADQERMDNQAKNTKFIIDAYYQRGLEAMKAFKEARKNGELDNKDFEALASYINATSGRGKLERGVDAAKGASEAYRNVAEGNAATIEAGGKAAGDIIDAVVPF